MRKYFIILAILFAGAAAFVLLRREPQSPATSPGSVAEQKEAKSSRQALLIGDPKAKLALVAYGDFQCPRCNRFFHEVEPQIRQEFVDQGLLKIEWHNFATIGLESVEAAQAAHCSADQKFFPEFYDAVFNYMDKNYWSKSLNGENVGALSNSRLKRLAAGAYDLINQRQFNDCLDKGKYAKTVSNELEEAKGKGFSLNTYVVGKQVIQGVQPFSIFRPVIQSQL